MIAITFALPAESSGLLRQLKSRRVVSEKGAQIFYGKIESHDVAVLHTGVGRVRCQRNVETLLHTAKPELLISSGFAGSLTQNLRAGDIIVAKNYSDGDLMARLLNGELELHSATLLTVDAMIDSAEERTRIAQQNGADAIDMETDMIAKLCATHGVQLLSLRVISDSADAPFPAPSGVLFDVERQKTKFGKLFFYLVLNPSAIGRLIRFTGQVAKARNALSIAIPEVIQQL